MNFSILIVLSIVFSTYWGMARYQRWAPIIALSGVSAVLITGESFKFYDISTAQKSINIGVLMMMVCLGLITDVVTSSRFFDVCGVRLCRKVRANPLLLLIFFNVFTFIISLTLNNLTVIYVLLPLVLVIGKGIGFSSNYLKLLTISMIISSNVGGASTAVGDIPNQILAIEKRIPFSQFFWAMAPINTLSEVLFLVLIVRLYHRSVNQNVSIKKQHYHETYLTGDFASQILEFDTRHTKIDLRYLKPCCIVAVLMFIGFLLSGFLHYPLELVALVGVVLVLIAVPDGYRYIKEARLRDALLLGSLFVLAGAAQATGGVNLLAELILEWSKGDHVIAMVLLIIVAGLLTSAFSAGPTTATLLPVADALTVMVPGSPNLPFFALSFGVLAGSSMQLYAATAGPIAASLMEESTGIQLGFGDFIKIGWMAFLIFEIVSIFFVMAWLKLT